jgi:hypothetical protein
VSIEDKQLPLMNKDFLLVAEQLYREANEENISIQKEKDSLEYIINLKEKDLSEEIVLIQNFIKKGLLDKVRVYAECQEASLRFNRAAFNLAKARKERKQKLREQLSKKK